VAMPVRNTIRRKCWLDFLGSRRELTADFLIYKVELRGILSWLLRHSSGNLPGKASRFWKRLLVPGIISESPNIGESEFLHHRSKNKYKVI